MGDLLPALKEVGSLAIVAYVIYWGTTKINVTLADLARNMADNTAALMKVSGLVELLRQEKEVLKRDARDAKADARDATSDERAAKAETRDVRADAREVKADERDARAEGNA